MSQHDFDISNQSFPATRSDLNNALKALASNSSGNTAPTTTYANQWWFDTTGSVLYLRNSDNNAWVTIAYVDPINDEIRLIAQAVQANDAGGIELKTDDGITRLKVEDDGDVIIASTGVFYPNSIRAQSGETLPILSQNGVTSILIEDDGNVNVDSGSLYVDVSSNNVGFGVTSPGSTIALPSSSSGAYNIQWQTSTTAKYATIGGMRSSGALALLNGMMPSDTVSNGFESSVSSAWARAGVVVDYGQIYFYANDASTVSYGSAITPTLQARLHHNGNFYHNSGYGSAAVAYGCRAWVKFDGTGTVAINGSGNFSSITDLGTGYYQPNFATAMPDTNYSISDGPVGIGSAAGTLEHIHMTTTYFRVITRYSTVGSYDWGQVFLQVFR